ncbi:MAG TPA: DUF3592 domain-containing protein, partial [Beijerinckiaceae bacterium]|nr:DUF3592 domain-containing protein [Beijerinckiaceae bacterium]
MASAQIISASVSTRRRSFVPAIVLAFALFPAISYDEARAQSYVDAGAQPYLVIGGWLAAVLFLGIGIYLLQKGWRYRRTAAASVLWPTASGTVTSSEISKREGSDDGQRFNYFMPVVTYSYKVAGTEHRGNTIKIGLEKNSYPSEKVAAGYIERYPIGSTIQVRYDPTKPDFSLLEIGQIGGTRQIFAGVLLAIVGIGAVVFAVWSASLPT